MPFAFGAGLAFAYCTIKFRSIWVAVLAHFLINLNSCIVQLIVKTAGIYADQIFLVYSIFVFCCVLSLVIAGLILYGIRVPKSPKPDPELRRIRTKLVVTSPFFYVFLALSVVVIVVAVL